MRTINISGVEDIGGEDWEKDTRNGILTEYVKQPRCPQVDRPRPHCHQRQPARTTPHLLQEQEVPPARPPRKADPCHPQAHDEARGNHDHREAEEEAEPLPPEELCRQGAVDGRLVRASGFNGFFMMHSGSVRWAAFMAKHYGRGEKLKLPACVRSY